MSYDIHIGNFDRNLTFNMGKFLHDHIGVQNSEEPLSGLQYLDGLTGQQAIHVLGDMWKRINQTYRQGNPRSETVNPFNKYEPANGWGSVSATMILLGEVDC